MNSDAQGELENPFITQRERESCYMRARQTRRKRSFQMIVKVMAYRSYTDESLIWIKQHVTHASMATHHTVLYSC